MFALAILVQALTIASMVLLVVHSATGAHWAFAVGRALWVLALVVLIFASGVHFAAYFDA